MIGNRSVLALITARGGSKGLPGKNIREVAGKPLIAWTIAQARASRYIDTVLVSTDDETIAAIAREHGAEVPFLRPAELAQDSSPTMDTVYHALDWYEARGTSFDIVALLEPTSPLRKKGDIDHAIEALDGNTHGADALVSLGAVHLEHPSITKVVADGLVRPLMDTTGVYQRQQLSTVYFPYGVIYASTAASLRATGTFYPEKTVPYFIERWQNYEIDDLCDLLCVEAIMQHKMEDIG